MAATETVIRNEIVRFIADTSKWDSAITKMKEDILSLSKSIESMFSQIDLSNLQKYMSLLTKIREEGTPIPEPPKESKIDGWKIWEYTKPVLTFFFPQSQAVTALISIIELFKEDPKPGELDLSKWKEALKEIAKELEKIKNELSIVYEYPKVDLKKWKETTSLIMQDIDKIKAELESTFEYPKIDMKEWNDLINIILGDIANVKEEAKSIIYAPSVDLSNWNQSINKMLNDINKIQENLKLLTTSVPLTVNQTLNIVVSDLQAELTSMIVNFIAALAVLIGIAIALLATAPVRIIGIAIAAIGVGILALNGTIQKMFASLVEKVTSFFSFSGKDTQVASNKKFTNSSSIGEKLSKGVSSLTQGAASFFLGDSGQTRTNNDNSSNQVRYQNNTTVNNMNITMPKKVEQALNPLKQSGKTISAGTK